MYRKIDESRFLSKLLESTSNFLARYRGLPIIFGIVLIVVSMIVQSVDVYTENKVLSLVGVITHNLGVLIALVGVLVSTPIGR